MKYLNSCIVLTSKLVIITAILLILFKTVAFAQPFGPQQALSAGALWSPSQIQSADLNNDGLLDIIICDENNIQGCFNNGDETFSFLECLVPDIRFAKITIADFDNNGSLDIAHVNVHNGYVFGWNKNDGYGHFHHTDTIASDTLIPAFIVSGDIDNDGVVEIILTEGTLANRRFISYHYDGNGQFIPQQNAPIAEHGIAQDLIDIDNDNDLDLIIYSNESYYWLENIGNGIFQQEHTILNEVIYISCFVDMDFDTDMDIIYYSSYRLLWKENMGNGVFGPESLIDSVFYIRDIKCGDMNNDGNIDILTGHYSTSGIQLYVNSGSNTFNNCLVIYSPDKITHLIINDYNNDSILDFAFIKALNLSYWFKNQGDLIFQGPLLLTSQTIKPIHAVITDIDQDNDLDISCSSRDNKLSLFENINNQSFNHPVRIIDTAEGSFYYTGFNITDLDYDGYNDIFFLTLWEAYWAKNDGFGNYNEIQPIFNNFSYEVWNSKIADVNNDNFTDLIITRYNGTYVFTNDGEGNFNQSTYIYYSGSFSKQVNVGDMDEDTDLDLILTYPETDKICIYFNDGTGQFNASPSTIYSGEDRPGATTVSDMDNDGDIDIVVCFEDKVQWLENNGHTVFNTSHPVSDIFGYSSVIFPTDLDDDGDEDLLYGFRDHYVVWSENLGGGIFDSYHLISDKTKYPGDVIAGDLDGDGDKDIVSVSSGDSKIAWYENLRINTHVPAQKPIKNSQFNVYPNPTSGRLIIQSNLNSAFEIELFDMVGNSVMKEEDKSISQSKTIDISYLPSNLYVVVIRINGELMHSEKVVLIKK